MAAIVGFLLARSCDSEYDGNVLTLGHSETSSLSIVKQCREAECAQIDQILSLPRSLILSSASLVGFSRRFALST